LSVSFDRAAGYYDQTRSLPDDLMEVLVTRLVAELPRDGRCLEVGIGTGRIALPLMQRGVDVMGVDISMEMLRRFREKSGSRTPPIAIADATRLPFADATFASAIAAHVLHLIPAWRVALDELQRVLLPGGVVLASRAGGTRSEWQRAVRRHFYVEAGDPSWPPGIDTIELLDEEMRARGCAVREVEDVSSKAPPPSRDCSRRSRRGSGRRAGRSTNRRGAAPSPPRASGRGASSATSTSPGRPRTIPTGARTCCPSDPARPARA